MMGRYQIVVRASVSAFLSLSGCATANLTESGRLSSYSGLKPSDGVLTRSKVFIDKRSVLAARSVQLQPTIIESSARVPAITPQQLQLVSNAVDRSLCRDLGRRFSVVIPGQPADLTVQAAITHMTKTDTAAAGVSVATGIGGKVASAATGIPLPIPRVPLGLGSLTVEGEARDAQGRQLAALVWGRGADAITTSARVSEEADAYALASKFAGDFAKLLVTGDDPIANPTPLMPTVEAVGEFFGADPRYAGCRRFGREPGLADTVGGAVGLPPSWTDQGAAGTSTNQ
jgi:hypothetical protein